MLFNKEKGKERLNISSIMLQSLKSHILLINNTHNASTIKEQSTSYAEATSLLKCNYIRGLFTMQLIKVMEKNAGVFIMCIS